MHRAFVTALPNAFAHGGSRGFGNVDQNTIWVAQQKVAHLTDGFSGYVSPSFLMD
jgi:hypothetical protein